jgi:hypothetical protein
LLYINYLSRFQLVPGTNFHQLHQLTGCVQPASGLDVF